MKAVKGPLSRCCVKAFQLCLCSAELPSYCFPESPNEFPNSMWNSCVKDTALRKGVAKEHNKWAFNQIAQGCETTSMSFWSAFLWVREKLSVSKFREERQVWSLCAVEGLLCGESEPVALAVFIHAVTAWLTCKDAPELEKDPSFFHLPECGCCLCRGFPEHPDFSHWRQAVKMRWDKAERVEEILVPS